MAWGRAGRNVQDAGHRNHAGLALGLNRAQRGAALLGLLVMSGTAGLAAATPSSASASSAPPGTAPIQAAPRVPDGARATGAVPASAAVSGAVVLKPRDNAALAAFIADVTDKSSALFHQYLPAGAFASRFGPSRSAINAVTTQLKADGLRVSGVSSDGLVMHFSGTAGQVGAAFHTGLESYRLRDGAPGRATTSAISLPSSIAGSVLAVVGLNDLVQPQPLGIVRAPASARGKIRPAATANFSHPAGSPTACPSATAAARAFGGLTDDQIGHAYGAFGLYGGGDLGAGQHIAVYELEPFLRSDVKTFDTCYFGAARAASMLKRLHVIPVDGGQPTGPGSGEANLDVEDISALAPDATIDVYEGPSPGTDGTDYDPVDNYVAIIDADRDQVVSTSWGLCEQAIEAGQPGLQQAENALFEQAAAQGQSVFSAAGDNGSDDCNTFETSTPVSGQNPVSVDDPGSQPYVVSVGGTTIDDAASQPPLEHVWNDGADGGGGGGGISQSWAMPAWQREATVPGIARPGSADYTNAASVEKSFGYPQNFCQSTVPGANASTPCRTVPDVSSQGDEFTGAITVYDVSEGGWTTIGGTSSSTPIWAAMLALVNASPTCASRPLTRGGVGFVSPLLYAVASDPGAYDASFNDITTGNNDIYGVDNGLVFPATTGYDLASGLGSPQVTGPGGSAGLAYYLCSMAAQPSRPVVSQISPPIGGTAGGERVVITGTGFESGGSPDVATIEVGAAQLPPSQFSVRSATTIVATLPPARDARPPLAPSPQDGAGPAAVIVTLSGGQSSTPGPRSVFEYVDTKATGVVPSITGVVPYAGSQTPAGKVTILGSGFTGATSVTFGGVPAAGFVVNSPYRITATAPAYSSRTACAPLPATGVYRGENATNDICQVQVRVSNPHGTSATGRIRPPDEGAVVVNSLGVLVAPPGCGCETMQAPTEFDYAPKPSITSVSTSAGAASLASEKGGTVVTVHGKGLDPLTIDWADFGNPALESSMATDFVFVTGTEMQIVAPGQALTVDPSAIPLRVTSLAGQSAPATVTYAGVPKVTAVVNTVNSTELDGTYGAPDTGRTPIQVTGQGFAGQLIAPIEFTDTSSPYSLGTQYTFTVSGNTSLSTQTVAQNPALVDVQLCTVTACSRNRPAGLLYIYPPGNPRVTSVSPASGPAAGGTKVTIGGDNLGCPLEVFFGNVKAESFTTVQALLDCGSTTTVRATSPPGMAGATVPVTVGTIESYFTGSGRGTTTARFTYK
jgi:Pro-kumamolisin, activation domain/IPT/TIG domain